MNESSIIGLEHKSKDYDLSLSKKLKRVLYLGIKRIFDILISLILLTILSPIFILIGLLIRLEDKKCPIYKHNRIGKNGKIFKMYKFRSMVKNADTILEEMLKDEKIKKEYKKKMKLKHDPRITKIGKILRKTSIDELPQLINVLKGDMSLVGNRPYLPREKEDIGPYYDTIVKTKPGITGYWQVSGRNEVSFEERLKLESYYSKNMSLLFDIKIILLTVYVVISGKGAQ